MLDKTKDYAYTAGAGAPYSFAQDGKYFNGQGFECTRDGEQLEFLTDPAVLPAEFAPDEYVEEEIEEVEPEAAIPEAEPMPEFQPEPEPTFDTKREIRAELDRRGVKHLRRDTRTQLLRRLSVAISGDITDEY